MKIFRKVIFTLLAFFLVEIYIDSNVLKVSDFTIKDKKIPPKFNGYKILHLSDLHSKSFGYKNINLVNKINKISPDIIVMTGDMVNCNDTNFDNFFNLVKLISSKYEIYYIVGNHEQSMKDENRDVIIDYLKANGVKVLDNEKVSLEKDGESINLYGAWCNLRYYSSRKSKERYDFTLEIMNKIMKDSPLEEDKFNILLAHNPNYIEAYSKWGADLTLSGHIHGGMVRLPFLGGIFSPDTLFFPKYSAGLYDVNGKKLIVSRGLGRGVRGFRFFNRPEINVITLENNK